MKDEVLKDLAWAEGYLDACGMYQPEFTNCLIKDTLINVGEKIEELWDCSEPRKVTSLHFKIIELLSYARGNIEAEFQLNLPCEQKDALHDCLNSVTEKLVKDWESYYA